MARTTASLSRSEQMARIRDRDTIPELLLRRALWHMGYRYRLRPHLLGRPDIAFARQRVLVFADGCFWHGCPVHYVAPKTRKAYWSSKVMANIARDKRNDELLSAAGWTVLRLWEHDIEGNPNACARKVAAVLRRRRRPNTK